MKRGNTRPTWSDGDMRAAAAACAAQLPVAGLLAFVLTLGDDDYGVGGPALGLACVILFAPLLLPVLGLVHSAVLTLPAVELGRRVAALCGRGPEQGRELELEWEWEWAWSVGGLLPVGAAWAGFFALLGAPFAGPALWIAVSGVVPALNITYCRRRRRRLGRPLRKVWIMSGLISAGVTATALGLAVAATVTGLIKEYEPPRVDPEQVAGAWRSEDDGGVRFRLYADGRAEPVSCHGAGGTWTMGTDDSLARPTVVVSDCHARQAWLVGGTADDPELFVNSGSMDSPDIEILRRER
ncbi:hypothetical protein ACFVYR_18820 [Streptomyces sp. NPDC058284]|uniref:hypothetical protein n=1 Tax=unclassified Streptomyces TaxID=2593676 RepID=UPI00365449BB